VYLFSIDTHQLPDKGKKKAPPEPNIPRFLQGLTWIDFRKERPDPPGRLIWGIREAEASPSSIQTDEWTKYSNGQTEGKVNKLKCIKRQMYGRAKFDLLRQRMLLCA
jgi:hypothetical protein